MYFIIFDGEMGVRGGKGPWRDLVMPFVWAVNDPGFKVLLSLQGCARGGEGRSGNWTPGV